MSIVNKLSERLEFISEMQELLGRYTGMLLSLYDKKDIDSNYCISELYFVHNLILQLEGSTSESVVYLEKLINSIKEDDFA